MGAAGAVSYTHLALEKAHTYVELNFGKTYLSELEEKRINQLMCRDIHSDCSLYFTEGILKSPVKRNYQYEYCLLYTSPMNR